MSPALWTCFFVYSFFTTVLAQSTHIVTVGTNGSFYDPPTLSAGLNDLVVFKFTGPPHSIVQCALEKPCFPLSGGFSSGLASRGDDGSIPEWTLKITNVSQPIWFYCANTVPVSHCTSGMVGAINPPSIAAYQVFREVAEQVSVLPTSFPTVADVGQGASAMATPEVPSTTSATSTSPPTPPPLSSSDALQGSQVPITSTPTLTSSSSPSQSSAISASSNKGAIIGGSVGGVAGLIIACLALVFVCRRHRQRPDSSDFFRYAARSPEFSSPGALIHTKMVGSPPGVLHSPPSTTWTTSTVTAPSASAPLVPQRYNPNNIENVVIGPRAPQVPAAQRHSRSQPTPAMMERRISFESPQSRNRDSTSGAEGGGLAGFHPIRGVALQSHFTDSASQMSGLRTESPAPPRYQPE